MLCISFIPFGLAYLSKFIWVPKFSAYFGNSLGELFNSSLVENSYYLIFITMAAGALTLVFTVDKPARFTLKSLFEKPSVLFLILFGIFTETAAGFTRVIRIDNIIFKGLMFGLIYLIAAYIITYHNKQSTVKYLLWFSVIGIGAETISGIIADISQRQHNTMYFVLSAIICVLIGRFIALKTSAKAEIVKV